MGPHVPEDMQKMIQGLEKTAIGYLMNGKYRIALQTYELIYNFLVERQNDTGKRIHLGAPLHMMGLSFLFLRNLNESLNHFLLAYIADIINSPIDNPSNADGSPAFNALSSIFQVNQQVFTDIKVISVDIDRDEPFDPREFMREYLEGMDIEPQRLPSYVGTSLPSDMEINRIQNQLIQQYYVAESGVVALNKAKDDFENKILQRAAEIARLKNRENTITTDDINQALEELTKEKGRYVY